METELIKSNGHNNLGTQIEQLLIVGDLAKLDPEQRVTYYQAVCQSVGLNPLTRPFDYIALNGKLTLYAKRDCTDQLRKIHAVSITIVDRATSDDVYVVTARATDKTGRCDESTGAVVIGNLKGEARANALMKAETKAKRRVTLSICGLGLLDETEMDTIPGAVYPKAPSSASAPSTPTIITATVATPGESAPAPSTSHLVSPTQVRDLQITLRELLGNDRAKVIDWVSKTVGHKVASSKELTVEEFHKVMEAAKNGEMPSD